MYIDISALTQRNRCETQSCGTGVPADCVLPTEDPGRKSADTNGTTAEVVAYTRYVVLYIRPWKDMPG